MQFTTRPRLSITDVFRNLRSGIQCRNPFPILYSREYVASLNQLGSDILMSFIYLFLSYGKKNSNFTSHTLPEIMLTVYQVFLQVILHPVKAQLQHAYATSCALSFLAEFCGKEIIPSLYRPHDWALFRFWILFSH